MNEREQHDAIVPAAFPGLREITWNRDPTRPIPAREVFALYERNWRSIDVGGLTEAETALIAELTVRFGHGIMMV